MTLFLQKMDVGDVCFRNSNHFKRIGDSSVADSAKNERDEGMKRNPGSCSLSISDRKIKGERIVGGPFEVIS